MFKRFFNKSSSDRLSKADYWKRWELSDLFDDLHKAERFLVDIAPSKDNKEFSDFTKDFIEELYEIEFDNVADFTRIWEWFTPMKEWDTIVGLKGQELGHDIFSRTDRWKRNQDFLKATKVSLKSEFGVVLDKSDNNEMYGLIRWDTNKDNDIEDWRGLFGTFLQSGGQVISQDHEFNFINDDGTMKKASS